MHKIHILFDEDAILTYLDVNCTDVKQLKKVKAHIDTYEFDTPEEVEAFRFGVCAAYGKGVKDFFELTDANLKQFSRRLAEADSSRRE